IVISLLLLGWFKYLPLPIVASILVYVAIRMVEREHFIHFLKHDKKAFALSLVVAIITIVEDPIIGIMVGSIIALLLFVSQLAKGQSEITFNKNKKVVQRISGESIMNGKKFESDVAVYRFAGQLSYINASSHAETLEKLTGAQTLVLSFRNLFFADVDGVEVLGEIVESLERKNQNLYITGVPSLLKSHIRHTAWYKKLEKNGKIFESTTDALQTLGFNLLKI
ncbi:MAG: STAS domain-containing protein, partial [Candidatus Magasanikbacteria bacterium]